MTKLIAEISCNHKQDLEHAKELIESAHYYGADWVKMQVYTPDELANPDSKKKFDSGYWKGYTLYELYQKTHTPYEWLPELFSFAESKNIPLFTSVYSVEGLKKVESMVKNPMTKISSFESSNFDLVYEATQLNKPVLISLGNISYESYLIKYHEDLLNRPRRVNPIFMACSSDYEGLKKKPDTYAYCLIDNLKKIIGKFITFPQIGYSDHNPSPISAQIATLMDCKFIEAHYSINEFTFDSDFSLIGSKLRDYKNAITEALEMRQVESFKKSIKIVNGKREII